MNKGAMKIALIATPIAAAVATILVIRWTVSSPSLATLIEVDIGIGVATFVGLFEIGFMLNSTINGVKDSVNDVKDGIRGVRDSTNDVKGSINDMKDSINDMKVSIDDNTRRIIEALESQMGG